MRKLFANGATLLPIIGIALSLYAYYVEVKAKHSDDFQALCDISPEVSCSKVFLSEHGRLLSKLGIIQHGTPMDVPNSLLGSMYYSITLLLFKLPLLGNLKWDILLLLSTISLVTSAFLSYALYVYVDGTICIVCASTYVCNILLFAIVVRNTSDSKAVITR